MRGLVRSIVAPKERKPLSADALFRLMHSGFAKRPDSRPGETESAVTEARRAAFAMVARKAPSLLAFDPQRAAGHVQTIAGIAWVPCDTRRRESLAPLFPAALRPLVTRVFRQLQGGTAREPMALLEASS